MHTPEGPHVTCHLLLHLLAEHLSGNGGHRFPQCLFAGGGRAAKAAGAGCGQGRGVCFEHPRRCPGGGHHPTADAEGQLTHLRMALSLIYVFL